MHDWEFPQKWYSFVAMVVTLAQHIIQAPVITLAQWIRHDLELELATEAFEACPVTDMEFVKNFTHPDFQAKNFTPQKCVICDIFLAN